MDGRDYIGDAVASGAAAIVCETGDGFVHPVVGGEAFCLLSFLLECKTITDSLDEVPSQARRFANNIDFMLSEGPLLSAYHA